MITISVDFHKRVSQYSVRDESGAVFQRVRMENKPALIQSFLQRHPEPKQLAMEATRNWELFYETVRPHVQQFYLGHPKKMKMITQSETKNDRHDADALGYLTHLGFLPQSHVPCQDIRQLRSLLRFRFHLVQQRKSIRNQVQILIDRNMWPCERPKSFKDLFCQRGLRWLKELSLPERERFILNQCLETFQSLSHHIEALELYLEDQAVNLPGLKSMRTVPGFQKGRINIYTVLLEIDQISRFSKAKSLAHYAGLIPSDRSSADKQRQGRLVKGANLNLRQAIIESTWSAIRHDKNLKIYYKQVKERAGSGGAIVACARKLCYAIYHVLKEQRSFRPFPPASACALSSVPFKG